MFHEKNFSTQPTYRNLPIPHTNFQIKFKPGDHFPIVRRKHFTVIELFAFVGGLLGLFLGISVVSFAEIINELIQSMSKKWPSVLCFKKQ